MACMSPLLPGSSHLSQLGYQWWQGWSTNGHVLSGWPWPLCPDKEQSRLCCLWHSVNCFLWLLWVFGCVVPWRIVPVALGFVLTLTFSYFFCCKDELLLLCLRVSLHWCLECPFPESKSCFRLALFSLRYLELGVSNWTPTFLKCLLSFNAGWPSAIQSALFKFSNKSSLFLHKIYFFSFPLK